MQVSQFCIDPITEEIEGSVSVVVFEILRQHVLGAGEKHIVPVQGEEIRALPHQADAVVVGDQRPHESPVQKVPALIQQHLSAFTEMIVYSRHTPPAVFAGPHLRVAEVKTAAALREIIFCENGIPVIFFVIDTVAEGEVLSLHVPDAAVRLHAQKYGCITYLVGSCIKFLTRKPLIVKDKILFSSFS